MPTPVGPRNRNDPIGRFGSAISARERRSARAIAPIASDWPTTASPSVFSMPTSRSAVVALIFSTGTPLIDETVSATSFSVASIVSSAWSRRQSSSAWRKAADASRSSSRTFAAPSKSPASTAASLRALSASSSSCIETSFFGRALAPARSLAPVSSIASIALSGSCRAGR